MQCPNPAVYCTIRTITHNHDFYANDHEHYGALGALSSARDSNNKPLTGFLRLDGNRDTSRVTCTPGMDSIRSPTAEAAEIVLREREREREQRKRGAKGAKASVAAEPKLEAVSTPKWEGAEAGEIDESELDRRQRSITEQLDRKQRELRRTGQELAKVRAELKALEEPIKAEIMTLRQRLEEANRVEKSLVESVNSLRKDLFEKEKKLSAVREQKQNMADDLIKVMADYERRKTERLNEIAHLVGEDVSPSSSGKPRKPVFQGF